MLKTLSLDHADTNTQSSLSLETEAANANQAERQSGRKGRASVFPAPEQTHRPKHRELLTPLFCTPHAPRSTVNNATDLGGAVSQASHLPRETWREGRSSPVWSVAAQPNWRRESVHNWSIPEALLTPARAPRPRLPALCSCIFSCSSRCSCV